MPEKMRIIFINLMCVLNSGANFEIVLLLKITLLKKFFQARVLYLSESLGSASSYFFLSLSCCHFGFPTLSNPTFIQNYLHSYGAVESHHPFTPPIIILLLYFKFHTCLSLFQSQLHKRSSFASLFSPEHLSNHFDPFPSPVFRMQGPVWIRCPVMPTTDAVWV